MTSFTLQSIEAITKDCYRLTMTDGFEERQFVWKLEDRDGAPCWEVGEYFQSTFSTVEPFEPFYLLMQAVFKFRQAQQSPIPAKIES